MDLKDYKSFLKDSKNPGSELDRAVSEMVAEDLRWLPRITFVKTLSAHWLAGLVTLSICPQFGWNPFDTWVHLPHVFMKYGMWACGLFCGVIFMALGASATRIILGANERVYMARRSSIFALLMSSLSMGALMLLARNSSGADIFFTESFISFWVIGAFVFDWATLKGWFSRYRSRFETV